MSPDTVKCPLSKWMDKQWMDGWTDGWKKGREGGNRVGGWEERWTDETAPCH